MPFASWVMRVVLLMRDDGVMRRSVLLVLAVVAAIAWFALVDPAVQDQPVDDTSTSSVDPGLPAEADDTMRAIDAGGPFPYDRDGAVFQNREGLLPQQPRGYWKEYTVDTPGSGDRGARRIVAGREGERYYTDDHYASFRLIRKRS